MKKNNYELWRKLVIEGWRAFFPAFLVVIFAQFEAGVNLTEWKTWLLPLISASTLAGFRALIKWAREKFAKDYSSILYKLPV